MLTDLSIEINTFSVILMRISGMVLTNQLLVRNNFPRLLRAGLVLVYALLVYVYADVSVEPIESLPEYVLILGKEFIFGFTLSIVVNMFIYVIMLAGEQIDMQFGIAMADIYDPGSNISMSMSGTFYNVMFIMIFFTSDAHLTMLDIFLSSGEVVPYGEVVINTHLSETILDIFCQCTVLGLKMALPLVFLELLLEFGVGALMKAVPQIEIFVVNIQMRLIIGMLLLIVMIQPMSEFVEMIITAMFDDLNKVIQIMSGG